MHVGQGGWGGGGALGGNSAVAACGVKEHVLGAGSMSMAAGGDAGFMPAPMAAVETIPYRAASSAAGAEDCYRAASTPGPLRGDRYTAVAQSMCRRRVAPEAPPCCPCRAPEVKPPPPGSGVLPGREENDYDGQMDSESIEDTEGETASGLSRVRKLPCIDKDSNLSFSKVFQGSTEPYPKFLDRLQASLERQIDNDEAREMLFKQFAYENANSDCRRALQSIPKRDQCTLAELVRACQDVGSVNHHTDSLATALAAKLHVPEGEKEKGGCF
ncbi:uncharacterized protein LOC127476184 [Manacus candei]|uniref:uncharacterized protein LOC127476184 n=2 Tax=Manacus candei TaxID=415023 RepID=UPI002225C12B|nr:uncharacterized protein LOC127476184 [Manacus candei]